MQAAYRPGVPAAGMPAMYPGAIQPPMGAKRTGMPMAGPAMKAQRTEGEGWLCEKCGNHNYENRSFCNMRKCGAPGPWTCQSCGNKNFAGRAFCNMRSCNQPRPAAGGFDGGGQQQAAIQALAMLQTSGLGQIPGVQEGITKIMSSAGVAGGRPQQHQQHQQQFQEGSWVCLGCGNINFPTRMSCNAKLCGRSRTEVDGGPPKAGASTKSIFMPGSWVCGSCQNINWPKRETCGMRSCNKSRAEVDAGAPSPQMLQAQHEADVMAHQPAMMDATSNPNADPANGAWNCVHCGNLNFAGREVCNKRTCGQPRMA